MEINLPDDVKRRIKDKVMEGGKFFSGIKIQGRAWLRWCHITPMVRVDIFYPNDLDAEKAEKESLAMSARYVSKFYNFFRERYYIAPFLFA